MSPTHNTNQSERNKPRNVTENNPIVCLFFLTLFFYFIFYDSPFDLVCSHTCPAIRQNPCSQGSADCAGRVRLLHSQLYPQQEGRVSWFICRHALESRMRSQWEINWGRKWCGWGLTTVAIVSLGFTTATRNARSAVSVTATSSFLLFCLGGMG